MIEQGPRTRVDGLIEAIDETPGPAAPRIAASEDDESNVALRALRAELGGMAEVPAPPGIESGALAALRSASEALLELSERVYGRRPGGPPMPEEMGRALLEVARAWPAVLAADLDILDRQRLAHHLRFASRPPDTLLREILGFRWPGEAPPEGERVVQELCAALRGWAGEHVVVLHARSLVRTGRPSEAAALLREHGSSPAGPGHLLEQIVSVAEGLAEAGGVEEAARRLRVVAGRVWGEREARTRARTLLGTLLSEGEVAAERERWAAADALRAELLAGG